MSSVPKCFFNKCLAGLAIALTLPVAGGLRAIAQEQAPSPVVAARIVEKNVAAEQTFVGTVTPLRQAIIGSAVSGRVIERPVDEGDRVEANQTLAQLLTDTISLEIAAAEGELDLRQQELAELRNGTRPEEIAQAAARLAAADARREFLDARFGRMRGLLSTRGAVTEEEVEEAKSLAIGAQQTLLEMQAAHELALAGPRREVIAQAEAQVAIQQATVDRLKDQKKKHRIISRFPGYVIRKLTEAGQWVNQGDPVVEIASIDEVDVIVQVVEKSVVYVVPGEEVSVEIPALPDRNFVGRVITTVPQGDLRARTFPVKIRVKNEITSDGPLIKAGMYARAALPVGGAESALMVPKDAIVLGGAQPVVFVVPAVSEPGATVVPQSMPVELGVAQGDLIQISGDVQPGQLVVVQGNERIRPNQQVRIARIIDPE